MGVPLYQLVALLLKDPASFRTAVATPALIWEGPPIHQANEGEAPFNSQPTAAGTADGALRSGEIRVYFVKKDATRTNAFPMGVTVGRLSSNDIVLDHQSVSRFHAFLQLDAKSGRWSLTDAGSDNGTFLDGHRLDPRASRVLNEGAKVTFGGATLTFLTPDGLARYVAKQGTGSSV